MMKTKVLQVLIILAVIVSPKILRADRQNAIVSGQVMVQGEKETLEPLAGVNVAVKGSGIGTITDAEGRYKLEALSNEAVLVFSFIGYLSEEVTVGGQSQINVTLKADVKTLGEVVVAGAVIKKSDLTGSIAAIDGEKLRELPTASVVQALTGRLAGVLIQNSPGVSGGASIKIRGNNSIQFGANPIFVVDGLIIDGGFNLLNPTDIESIDVLKDASATALYGARGANGVVIVTTKKGKKGVGQIGYDAWYSVQQFTKMIPRASAQELFDLRVDAFANTYMETHPTANRQQYINDVLRNPNSPETPFAPYEFDTYNSGKSYNWLNSIIRGGGGGGSGSQHNHTLSFSKGNNDGAYYMSFNYANNTGLLLNSKYDRITGKINAEQNIKPWLKFGTTTTYARSHETYLQGGVFDIANGANPLLAVSDTITYLKWAGNDEPSSYNPIRSLTIDGDGYQSRLMTTNYMAIKISAKINLRSSVSIDLQDGKDFWYTPAKLGQSLRNSTAGKAQQRNDHWLNWQWDNTITYGILSGDHNLTALGGFSMQRNRWDANQLDATGFATDDFSYKNVGGAYQRDQFGLWSDFQTNSIQSFIGRLNYSYKEKYFATMTGRYDGSSRFGDGHKWGLFPSVALGWNLAEEDFFRNMNIRFINLFKWRVGYGIAGNQNIPNFAYKTLYTPAYTNKTVTFRSDGRLGNPNLSWEKQKQTNIGLDVGLLNNRVNITFDYFNILNDNLLMERTLSSTVGFNNTIANVGALKNEGVELTVNVKVLDRDDFRWSLSGNISSATNKITKLYGDVKAIYKKGGYTGVEIEREGNLFLGESINSIYVYKFDKIAQQGDMDRIAKMNLGGRIVKPGDILPKDSNDDKIIDNEDRYVVGKKDPKFYGGFSTDATYKNFTINAVFSYNYGAKRISHLYEGMLNGGGMSVAHKDILNRWTPENTNTNVPRAYSGGGRYGMGDVDLGVQDASFLRMSAFSLAYSVPTSLISRAKLSSLRIYFTGSNLFTFTKYKGYDPEGGDGYPTSKQFVTGLDLRF